MRCNAPGCSHDTPCEYCRAWLARTELPHQAWQAYLAETDPVASRLRFAIWWDACEELLNNPDHVVLVDYPDGPYRFK